MIDSLERGLRFAYMTKGFWMVMDGKVKAGPFDGGSLVCANAIMLSVGEGDIVRIVDANTGETFVYGVEIDGAIYDFDGAFNSVSWVEKLIRTENVRGKELKVARGVDDSSSAKENESASLQVMEIIMRCLGKDDLRLAG